MQKACVSKVKYLSLYNCGCMKYCHRQQVFKECIFCVLSVILKSLEGAPHANMGC